MTRYEAALDATVASYLLARGIEEQAARTHRLGVVADPIPGHEARRGRLAIPYLHRSGYPLTIRFRCLKNHACKLEGCPKYLPIEGDPVRMFGTKAIFEADDEISVTEGELDAVILNQLGIPAVAIPGANNWASHHRRMLAGFSKIHVFGDPDAAGAEFIAKVCRSLRQARGVRMQHGDVTETHLAGGEAAIRSLME